MSRGLPNAALAELYAAESTGQWLVLLTIGATPLRFVNDTANVTSNGNVFTALAFTARLPADRDEAPRAIVSLDNTDQSAVAAVRSVTTPAAVTVQLIRRSAPDTVLASWALELRGCVIRADALDLELHAEPVLEESYPGTDFTPLSFPAMFDR